MLCYAIPCYAMLCYAIPSHAVLRYAMLSHAVLFYAIPCYAIPCCAMLSHAMISHAIPCCATPILCYAIHERSCKLTSVSPSSKTTDSPTRYGLDWIRLDLETDQNRIPGQSLLLPLLNCFRHLILYSTLFYSTVFYSTLFYPCMSCSDLTCSDSDAYVEDVLHRPCSAPRGRQKRHQGNHE
jgi:hypothetical protein